MESIFLQNNLVNENKEKKGYMMLNSKNQKS